MSKKNIYTDLLESKESPSKFKRVWQESVSTKTPYTYLLEFNYFSKHV